MANEVELKRVQLIPIKSSWTCPTCERQNVVGAHEHAGGLNGPASKGKCSNCYTEVILGIKRASTTSPSLTPEQAKAITREIWNRAIESNANLHTVIVDKSRFLNDGQKVIAELMVMVTSPVVGEAAHHYYCPECSDEQSKADAQADACVDQRQIDRQRIIAACGGRLTENDDRFIDAVTDVVSRARIESCATSSSIQSTAAEICAEMAREAATRAAGCRSGDVLDFGIIEFHEGAADALREAQRRIEAATSAVPAQSTARKVAEKIADEMRRSKSKLAQDVEFLSNWGTQAVQADEDIVERVVKGLLPIISTELAATPPQIDYKKYASDYEKEFSSWIDDGKKVYNLGDCAIIIWHKIIEPLRAKVKELEAAAIPVETEANVIREIYDALNVRWRSVVPGDQFENDSRMFNLALTQILITFRNICASHKIDLSQSKGD